VAISKGMRLIVTVPQVLEFMGYDSPSGTWDTNVEKKPITLKDLDNLMNKKITGV